MRHPLVRLRRTTLVLAAGALAVAATSGFAAYAAAASPAAAAAATQSAPSAAAPPSSFHGVNWADPRDNYASDAVVPSGLSVTDDYRTVYRTTQKMVDGFRTNLGANTLRLPINPASVGTAWWKSYRATIDAATASGDKVILSYWESPTAKDGKIDDVATWNQMWDTVTAEYRTNPRVYFEPMNEPFGYTLDQWVQVCTGWLAQHADVPRDHVVISGTGYNDNVTGVGATQALSGTLLSLHFYGYWASATTEADWISNLLPRIGGYASRTIIDEAGSPMTVGLNYGNHNGNVFTAYFAAVTDIARGMGMGMVYWPGLRTGDSYSIESLDAKGYLQNNSASGVAQLKWGYGLGTVPPVNDQPPAPAGTQVTETASGRCLDVPGYSTTSGTQLDLWDCNGGGNQSWDYTATHLLTVYSTKCMQAGTGTGTVTAGAAVVIEDCTGLPAQQWTVAANGTIASAADASLCLDTTGSASADGSTAVVAACSGSASQNWKLG
ncbi:Ricin B lectin [Catenulispora acidiphila DSM 44928]|uniref:Ricin B lectin n=1 Tax=Catenulispora acidiphila (strain DSM 44928 / JCM 14897 / NBRC 102108 / NRRL B-24433 / ID139908) TaxID=479433 RepID=C7QJQ6_CATAD|nr:ricin-type beta-trefoil lectin domain protein [Catenulispora acidiphila]ACU73144.1 Ricin B lectin [Catenulispora acidiphila DSM 44928]